MGVGAAALAVNGRRCRHPIMVNSDSNEIRSREPPPPPPLAELPPLPELGALVAVTCAMAWTDLGPDEQVIV